MNNNESLQQDIFQQQSMMPFRRISHLPATQPPMIQTPMPQTQQKKVADKRISLKYQRGLTQDKETIELDPALKQQILMNKRISLKYQKGQTIERETVELEPAVGRERDMKKFTYLPVVNPSNANPLQNNNYFPRNFDTQGDESQAFESAIQQSSSGLVNNYNRTNLDDLPVQNPDFDSQTKEAANTVSHDDKEKLEFNSVLQESPMKPLERKSVFISSFKRIKVNSLVPQNVNQSDENDEDEYNEESRADQEEKIEVRSVIDESFLVILSRNLRNVSNGFTREQTSISQTMSSRFHSRINISLMDILTFIVLIILTVMFIFLTISAINITEPDAYDDSKKFIANTMAGGLVINLVYGMLLLTFGNSAVFLALFFLQFIPGMGYYLWLHVNEYKNTFVQTAEPDYIICIYIISIYFLWLVIVGIKSDIARHIGPLYSQLFVVITYAMVCLLMICYPLHKASITLVITMEWLFQIIKYEYPCYMIYIFFASMYIYFRFYQSYAQQQDRIRNKYAIIVSGILLLVICNALVAITLAISQHQINNARNLYYVTSLNKQIEGETLDKQYSEAGIRIPKPEWAYYMPWFMLAFAPILILSTQAVLLVKINYTIKMAVIPIIISIIPTFFLMPLSFMFNIGDLDTRFTYMKFYFMFGPAAIGIYWLTLILIKQRNPITSIVINCFVFVFLFIPFLYILPFQQSSVFEEEYDISDGFYYGLIISGVVLLFLTFIILIIAQIRTTLKNNRAREKILPTEQTINIVRNTQNEIVERIVMERKVDIYQHSLDQVQSSFEFLNLLRCDLRDYGLWANSVGVIVAFWILAFMHYTHPSWVTEYQKGSLIGLMAMIIYLFVGCLILLVIPVVNESERRSWDREYQMSYILSVIMKLEVLKETKIFQERVRRTIMHIGFLDIPIICLILLLISITQDNDTLFSASITMMVGIFGITVILSGKFFLKANMNKYVTSLIPVLVAYTWVFIYIPFFSIVPSSLIYLSIDDEQYVFWERLVYNSMAILLVNGIATLCFIIFLFFKRSDAERKNKFIASQLIKRLAKNNVKADYYICDLIYEAYINLGEAKTRQALERNDPVDWIDYKQTIKGVEMFKPEEEQYLKEIIMPDGSVIQVSDQSGQDDGGVQDIEFKKMLVDSDGLNRLRDQLSGNGKLEGNGNGNEDGCSEGCSRWLRNLFKYCCCYNGDEDFLSDENRLAQQIRSNNRNNSIIDGGDNNKNRLRKSINMMVNGAAKEHVKRMTQLIGLGLGGWTNLDDDIYEKDDKDRDSFMKKYIRGLQGRRMPQFVYDALKWYEKPVHLHVDEYEQKRFFHRIYELFAQATVKTSKKKAIDYIGFKNLCVCARFEDNMYFYDYMIDWYYAFYTSKHGKPCKKPFEIEDLELFFKDIAQLFYPSQSQEISYGYLFQFYLFPHLLWNIIPLRPDYVHEWEYVLFLLRSQGYGDLCNQLLEEEKEFIRNMENELGIVGKEDDALNAEYFYNDDDLHQDESSWERFKRWLSDMWDDLKYYCKSCCYLDRSNANKVRQTETDEYAQGNQKRDDVEEEFQWINDNLLSESSGKTHGIAEIDEKTIMEKPDNQFSTPPKKQKKEKDFMKNETVNENLSVWTSNQKDKEKTYLNPTTANKIQQSLHSSQSNDQSDSDDSESDNSSISSEQEEQSGPNWNDTVDTIMDEIKVAEKKYFNKERRPIFVIRKNFTNCLTGLFKIIEFVIIASWAFRPEVDWGLSFIATQILNILNTESEFVYLFIVFFWFSFGSVFVFAIATYYNSVKARRFGYGYSEGGIRTRRMSVDFFTIQLVSILYYPGQLIVMKTIFDSFSCDYLIYHNRLYQDDSILCLTAFHQQFMGVAGMLFIFFIPIGAFLYPHLQWQNRSLDIKYDPSYLCFNFFLKMILCSICAFYTNDQLTIFMLSTFSIIIVLLSLLLSQIYPCLAISWNYIDTYGYLLVASFHICAIISELANSLAAWIVLAISLFLILLALVIQLFYIPNIIYNYQNKPKPTIQVSTTTENHLNLQDFAIWREMTEMKQQSQ